LTGWGDRLVCYAAGEATFPIAGARRLVPEESGLAVLGMMTRLDSWRSMMKLCTAVLLAGLFLPLPGTSVAQQPTRPRKPATGGKSNTAMVKARHDFETRCSSCHGLDGRGGEHAPNISTDPSVRRLPERDVFKIIHDGIPAKGMPAFNSLTHQQINAMVSYLRSVAGPFGWGALNGNTLQGEELFFGRAGCGKCHMMHGRGGFLGSDLTEYSASHTPGEAIDAILHPGKLRAGQHEMVSIVTRGGQRLSGVVRNEDNFSLQLLADDGTFHMLLKSDIERLERSDNLIMPSDYGQRLTRVELDDLVSYLAQGVHRMGHPSKKNIYEGGR
jgi:cytochrome c oxidase cbb3-type subunit 3